MARPVTAGDTIPANPPLKVLAVETRDNGTLRITVDLADDHPIRAGLVADALTGAHAAITGLIGHPGHPEDTPCDYGAHVLCCHPCACTCHAQDNQ